MLKIWLGLAEYLAKQIYIIKCASGRDMYVLYMSSNNKSATNSIRLTPIKPTGHFGKITSPNKSNNC